MRIQKLAGKVRQPSAWSDSLQPARRRRGAVLAAELLIVLPILLIFVAGMIEFSMILSARWELLAASEQGARVASQGGSDDDVKATVQKALGTGQLSQNAQVFVDRTPAVPGDPANNRDRVQVCVQVSAGKIVPDILVWAGISLGSQNLVGCSVMNQE